MAQKQEEIIVGHTGGIDTKAITRLTTKTHRIRWSIENFSKILFDEKLIGPEIYLTPTCLVSIALKRNTNIYVYLCNKSVTEFRIERKLSLLDCNDKSLHEESNAKVFELSKGQDIDVIETVQDMARFDALPNNTLIVDLSIFMRGEIMTEMCRFLPIVDPKKKLVEDLKTMLINSVNSDVFLQIDNERIPAHWSILCSRSSYFKKMFDSKMLERVNNSITITDLSLGSLKRLIKFLYTADFEASEETDLRDLFDIYYASDKYEVMDMRTLCGSKIIARATADNVCQIFELAHRHNDKNLKIQAMNFIQFHFDAVFQTDGWKKFEASEPLTAELFSFCLKKNKMAR